MARRPAGLPCRPRLRVAPTGPPRLWCCRCASQPLQAVKNEQDNLGWAANFTFYGADLVQQLGRAE